jgi:hypothetical protein
MDTLMMDQGIMMLVTIATIAICVALALYVLYSVIWHAVRRGLREYHRTVPPTAPRMLHRASVKVPDYLPSDWV